MAVQQNKGLFGRGEAVFHVAPGVTGMRIVFVNVYFVQLPGQNRWVLIDAGLAGAAQRIREEAEKLFGRGTSPEAILLTHGHFDHIGALKDLLEEWDVPVFAHPLEVPFLTGRSSYPPPDPTVGGGAMARLSLLFPKKPIDVGNRLQLLPPDGTVPALPGWYWLHTPGHAPGHVSFFREEGRVLIAGDAVVTTNQASFLSVLTQREEVLGPPTYFTIDWDASRASVQRLADLYPEVLATGHGHPLRGPGMQHALLQLSVYFWDAYVPEDGRYVRQPAISDEQGIVEMPPPMPDPVPKVLLGLSIAAIGGVALNAYLRRRNSE